MKTKLTYLQTLPFLNQGFTVTIEIQFGNVFRYVYQRVRFRNWLFRPCILPKSQPLAVLLVIFFSFFLNTYVFKIGKISALTIMKGFVLASDIWVSVPKLTFFIQTSGRI